MTPYTVYVVDDEEVAREGVVLALKKLYRIKGFANAEDTIEAVLNNPPDLVLLDIGLPGMSGIEALRKIKGLYPEVIVIMITAYEDVQTVVSAMKQGAYDYQNKYTVGATDYLCPAPLSPETARGVQQAALQAFHAIGGRDYGRVDVMVDGEGRPWVLEVNTLLGTDGFHIRIGPAEPGAPGPKIVSDYIKL